jgi:hypothetical protein
MSYYGQQQAPMTGDPRARELGNPFSCHHFGF